MAGLRQLGHAACGGSVAYREPLLRRLFQDAYKNCGDLQSEKRRLALLNVLPLLLSLQVCQHAEAFTYGPGAQLHTHVAERLKTPRPSVDDPRRTSSIQADAAGHMRHLQPSPCSREDVK